MLILWGQLYRRIIRGLETASRFGHSSLQEEQDNRKIVYQPDSQLKFKTNKPRLVF